MKKYLSSLIVLMLFIASQANAAVIGEMVKYRTGGTNLFSYIAYDDNIKGKRPAVIVVPDWWNNSKFARDRADTLAEMGYTAMVMDIYGDGKYSESPDGAGKLMNALTAKPKVMIQRFKATLNRLRRHETVDASRIGAIGYSLGGMYVIQMAREGFDLKSVASLWGVIGKPARTAQKGKVKASVLVLQPEVDAWAPKDAVDALKTEMNKAGADYSLIEYADTVHGFSRPDADQRAKKFNMGIRYNADADEKSWKDLASFLKRTLG